jgi:CRISP-associated protein Cas1
LIERACLYVGLDPYMGLYHSERYGKPSLVLDLVEEFRVPIIDSTIFPLFLNKQMEKAENFEPTQPGVYGLSNDGKRKIVRRCITVLTKAIASITTGDELKHNESKGS